MLYDAYRAGGACPGRSPRSQPSARHSSYSSVLSRKGQEHYHLQLYLRSRRDRPTTHAPKGHIHGGPSLLLLLPAKPRLMSVDVTLRASRVARPSPLSLPLAKSPMRGVTDALPPTLGALSHRSAEMEMRCVSMFVSSSTASPSSGGAITIGASGGLGLYLRHAWRGLRRLHAGRGLAKGSGQTAGREWLLRAPRRLAGVDVVVVRPARVVVDVLEPPVGQHALLRVHHREPRLPTPRTRLPRRRTHGSLPSRASAPTCCTMIEPTSSISFLTASSYAARAADPERVLTGASRLGAGGAG